MSILAFYDGHLLPLDELKISVNDRSYLFGDGIYEVLRVYGGKPFILDAHLSRLKKSLAATHLTCSYDVAKEINNIIKANAISEGMVYLQISRGTAPRVHSFHNASLASHLLIYAKPFLEHPTAQSSLSGIKAITLKDERWGRCDIKSINLLANCLAISTANSQGADEALLLRDDYLTEGSSCNVFIAIGGQIKTPPLTSNILAGTRRNYCIAMLREQGYQVHETAVHKEELYGADEVFITSTIKEALGVVTIDGKTIGSGQVGPLATLCRTLILERANN